MKKQIFMAIVPILALCSGLDAGTEGDSKTVDAITSASVLNHYKASSLAGDGLMALIRSRNAVFVLSTTNPDGSPNAGVFIPGVVSDSALVFGLARNQTRMNIERTGMAVLTVYRLTGEDPKGRRHEGARLFLRLREGGIEDVDGKDIKRMTLHITQVMPIG